MKPVVVRIVELRKTTLPRKHTAGAVGYDLYAAEDLVIRRGCFGTVGTGIAIQMPKTVEAQVRPRSGLAANHGIGVLNSPGTIDPDYRGEVKVILFNISGRDFAVCKGDRIAQIVFSRAVPVVLKRSGRLSPTRRGAGGFGHTG